MYFTPIHTRLTVHHAPIMTDGSEQARRAQSRIDGLELEIERLLMITESLWTILKEVHGYDDAELARRVEDIDLRDGALDGRVKSGPPRECSECGRKIQKRRPLCIYCGTPIDPDLFER